MPTTELTSHTVVDKRAELKPRAERFMGGYRLAERFGSGDGERKTLLTRQIAFEPLPASVLLGAGWVFDFEGKIIWSVE